VISATPAPEPDELVWRDGLTALELAEVRVGLLLRLSVAQSNARAERGGTARRRQLAGRVRALQALLDKLRPADGDVAALPKVEG
jgi:hypothetical protein